MSADTASSRAPLQMVLEIRFMDGHRPLWNWVQLAPNFGPRLNSWMSLLKGPLFSVQVFREFLTFFGPIGPDIPGARAH